MDAEISQYFFDYALRFSILLANLAHPLGVIGLRPYYVVHECCYPLKDA